MSYQEQNIKLERALFAVDAIGVQSKAKGSGDDEIACQGSTALDRRGGL